MHLFCDRCLCLTFICVSLIGIMPLLKNRVLPLRTITQTCVVRNMNKFWKEEWNPELKKITEASDDILMNLRKSQ